MENYYIDYIQHWSPEANHTTNYIYLHYNELSSWTRQDPLAIPDPITSFSSDDIYITFQSVNNELPTPNHWIADFSAEGINTYFTIDDGIEFPTPNEWLIPLDTRNFYAPFYFTSIEENVFPRPVAWLSSLNYENFYSQFEIGEPYFANPKESYWLDQVDYENIYSSFEVDGNKLPCPKAAEWLEPFDYHHLISELEWEIVATPNFTTLLEQFQNVEQLAWWTGNGFIRITGSIDPDGSGHYITINDVKPVKIKIPNVVALDKRPIYEGSQQQISTYKFLVAQNENGDNVFLNFELGGEENGTSG